MRNIKFVFSIVAYLLILTTHFGCNDVNNEAAQVNGATAQKITEKDISQIKYTEYVLSDLAEIETKDWLKFQELKTHIENLKRGDTSFFKDDKTIMQSFITDLNNETPQHLAVSPITVRLSVLKTIMKKLEETLSLKTNSKSTVINNINDLIIAYNNLILQINKTVEKESRQIEKPQ